MGNDNNSLPDLIELIARVGNDDDIASKEVRVELRINSLTLTTDDCFEFTVQLERANLCLDLDGLEVVPKSRFGEPIKPNDVSVEHKLTNEKTQSGEISGNLQVDINLQPTASIGGKVAGSATSRTTESVSSQQTYNFLRVKARGNLTWEISEPGDLSKPLGDTYLNDDVLCKLNATPGANMLAVKLVAFARKRDIKITPTSKLSRFSFKSKNHERLFTALVAKSLAHTQTNGGTITFSMSEIIIEDDQLR
ncbi:hypothetical protein [Bradyrhizobium aeschynomenes]|uniref:hypothetical protein n=1 Tax=Bradyrhizobium aeschynomenes TaxID=2734909 RepID=UPI001552407C|nr:hypothetical protein [Bradyrhizobium aeschynomenes]NPV19375.1 hypothetical protein [Bradyrhizobium aeschynomenes]